MHLRRIAPVVLVGLTLVACSSGSKATKPPAPVTTTTSEIAPASARVVRQTVVDPSFRQGLARDGRGWAFSLNNGLFLTDVAFRITKRLTPAIPKEWTAKGYDHIGDIDVENGVLYAPLEQPNYKLGHQAMLLYDAQTLAYKSGVTIRQHQNSFVTVDPHSNIAYSTDQFGGKALTRYDVAHDWRRLPSLAMSTYVDKIQGADVRDGAAWLSTDDAHDGVYWVGLTTGRVQALGSIGHIDGEGEGIDATPDAHGDLHVLSIDVKVVPVRVIELKVVAS